MVKRKYRIPGKCSIIAAALLCIVLGALTSCGKKEEPVETQLGIDGYVYVPRLLYTSADETASVDEAASAGEAASTDETASADETVSTDGATSVNEAASADETASADEAISTDETDGNTLRKISRFKVFGNNLYYFRDAESGRILERLPLPEGPAMPGIQDIDFSAGERLLEFPGGYHQETEEMPEEWNSDPGLLIDRLVGQGKGLPFPDFMQGDYTYSFYIRDYAVDEEGSIYCIFSMSRYNGLETEESKELLCRYGADGQLAYRISLDGSNITGMLPYGAGSLLLLAGNEIRKIDADGSTAERVDIGEYKGRKSINSERLYGEPGGKIYYVISYADLTREIMELVAEGGMRLRDVKDFAWKSNFDLDIQGYCDSNLYFTLHSDNMLYIFDGEEHTARKVLRWEESDIFSTSVMQLWPVGEDKIVVQCYSGSEEELYLLDRTPVGELPEKELVVLASLSPGLELRKAVVEFNRQSEKYHCVIEQYGAGTGTEDTGAGLRLDAAVLSASPPDILDMQSMDIYKYAEKGILEDLSPYMENSRTAHREDFLGGVLEGYTIGGSLVCIPTRFTLYTIAGRDSQTNLLEGWGIEDVYMLMESYPEMTELVSSGDRRLDGPEEGKAEGKGRGYMLEEFFPAYYLEEFIDWEAGECSFDSREFREFLLWLEGHVGKEQPETAIGVTIWETDYVPEYALLMETGNVDFSSLIRLEAQFGEKIRFLGFPTADGKGTAACRVMDKLGMVSHSLNKEGAWDFLEYYICKGAEDSYYLPTRISLLRDMAEKAVTPQSDKVKRFTQIGDDLYETEGVPQYLADALMEEIESLDFTPLSAVEEQIIDIVAEEAGIYYDGNKSLEDVTAVIQNRVMLLLKETH